MEAKLQLGTKVFATDGKFINKGVVEMVDGERKDGKFYYVRWHRGFAQWRSEDQVTELVRAFPEDGEQKVQS